MAAHKSYVHAVAKYLPVKGGAERYCADLSEGMVQRGYLVQVCTTRLNSYDRWDWTNDLTGHEVINGVPVRRFSVLRRGRITARVLRLCSYLYKRHPGRLYELGILFGAGAVCPALPPSLLIEAKHIALVNVMGLYNAMSWLTYRAARLAGIPIVVTPFLHSEMLSDLRLGWQREIARNADHIVALTDSEKAFLSDRVGVCANRISVSSPGICTDTMPRRDLVACRNRLGIPEGAFVVLFLGRNEEPKGTSGLLEAWRALRARGYTDISLVFAGPETAYGVQLLLGLTPADGVWRLGELDPEQKIDILNACDCLVLPSRDESFGIVLLEAWAVGKPVIATRLRTTSTIVDEGRNGYLVPYGAVGEIISSLVALRDSPERAKAMGEDGHQKVADTYTLDAMIRRSQDIYARVVGEDRRGG